MKIGMILNHPFPVDERVEKEAVSLINAGYEVYLLCCTFNAEPEREDYKRIKICRFQSSEKFNAKFAAAYLALPFYKMVWEKQIRKFVKENKIDVLHIHDLPLSDIGVKLKKEMGIKLVCDQHEYFSNWIYETAHYNTFLGKIVASLSNWQKYEEKNLREADIVMTVEKPLEEEYIENYPSLKDKIISIPNTPSKNIFDLGKVNQEIVEKYKDDFVIFYQGKIDILRGISTVVNALPELAKKIPNIKLVLAGKFAKNCDPVKDAENIGVSQYVDFVGWQPLELLPSFMAASNIGIFTPPSDRKEINKTIATKIYQYAVMQLPMIVGQAKMMKDFVEKHKLGLVVDETDTNDFIEKVLKLYNDVTFVEECKKNAKAIAEKFVWEETIKPLIDKYNKEIKIN